MNTITLPISSFPDEKQANKMTIPEFLVYLERYPNQRVELINGQVVAMAGGTSNHSVISMNCLDVKFFLRQNKPCCHVRNSDFGIQTKENQVRYPDFSIVCDIKGSDKIANNPLVVGEVLSEKSTALFDQTEKLAEYKNVHSIQEIFLIAQTHKEIVVHRRGKFFGWETAVYTQGLVEFASIGYTVDIDEIYAEVEFE
ncbi:Uma2 family endonuclease [Wielerella bovis]|uniref:Uma2 family endonuclease n=1 Tax=Wielerella bovis TaxID=2917790 RepID=UPI002019A2BB|nr:Uma2 family endonuclease [Wielerella bovis]ULJ59537.1 Uma2 family endonuclease [Wielerella bovis]